MSKRLGLRDLWDMFQNPRGGEGQKPLEAFMAGEDDPAGHPLTGLNGRMCVPSPVSPPVPSRPTPPNGGRRDRWV